MAITRLRQALSDAKDADDDRGHIVASIVPCMVLAFIALMMRLVSRRITRSRFFVSDYLAIAGLLCAWVVSLIAVVETRFGLGLHMERVSSANIREIVFTEFIGKLFYPIGFTLIKLSITALYRQLFPTRFMLFSTTLLAIFVTLWGIAVVLVSIFSCNPIHGFWDLDVPSKCVDSKWFFVGNAIPNILADVFLLILPMHDVWKLQLGRGSKIAVSGIFALGGFVTIVSGLRIHFTLAVNDDVTWSYANFALWTSVEINVAVISCCLPTVRPAIALLVPKWLEERLTGNSTQRSTRQQGRNIQPPRTHRTLGSHVKITSSQYDDFIPL
ncbi:hypothetical protein F4824DRAFT_507307 [Ustulina deusta]|nr:hypothetical protein F4824DRAFT_507307 [Ustulina deusta]